MKVSRAKTEFNPITITLETEEEANLMWHILNCGESRTLLDYWEKRGVGEFPAGLATNIWEAFDSCYSLGEYKKSEI